MLSTIKSAVLGTGLSLASFAASAQATMKDIVTKPDLPLTFMGVDFSGTRYFGDPGTVSPTEMKGLFTRIDDLMVKEADKYDLAKALHRNSVSYNISIAESVNEKIDPGTIISADKGLRNRFTAEKVAEQVKRYTYPAGSSGTGMMFVVEDLVKSEELTVFWVTFVDMATKKVIYTEKIGGTAGGFGFRNHWAGGIYDALKSIKSTKYANWKKRFAKG